MCDNETRERLINGGDERVAERLAQDWRAAGRSVREFYEAVLVPAAVATMQRFAERTIYLPEVLVFLRFARAALHVVQDAADGNERCCNGTIIVGSLAGNGHSLGRDVIVGLLEVCGWNVVDLGGNVSPARCADACAETAASVLVIADLPISAARMSSVATPQQIGALAEELDARNIRHCTRLLLVGFTTEEVLSGPRAADAACDDLADVLSSVSKLTAGTCA